MPRAFGTAKKPTKQDELVPIQVKIPVWMRDRLAEHLAATSQNLSSYIKALLVRELGTRP